MRFLRKVGIDHFEEVTRQYKDVELQLMEDDITDDNKEILIKIIKKNEVRLSAVHAPLSKFKTEEGDINYLSMPEILMDFDCFKLFSDCLNWLNDLTNNVESVDEGNVVNGEANVEESEEDDEEIEEKNESNIADEEKRRKVLFIVHAGSIDGCTTDGCNRIETQEFSDKKWIYKDKVIELLAQTPNVLIAIENITPFNSSNIAVGKNTGYWHENLELAKDLNDMIKEDRFFVAVDLCHIMATYKCKPELFNGKEGSNIFEQYFSEFDNEQKKLVALFHLSKYGENNDSHGNIFEETEDDMKLLDEIRKACFNVSRKTPITLEVMGSENSKVGERNFNKIILRWNQRHIFYKNNIDEELYNFFENMFYVFAVDEFELNYTFSEKVESIKKYVLDHAKKYSKIYEGVFKEKEQEIDIPLFRIRTYIEYVRYVYLLADLCEEYHDENSEFISMMLHHYMFNDKYQEIRFDGLEFYYNILWRKKVVKVYHMYDGCEGYNQTKVLEGNNIFYECVNHIINPNQHYSTSKYFGRDLLKYFQYRPKTDANGNFNYNLEIVNDMANYVKVSDTETISLQEYVEREDELTKIEDYSVDFSAFLESDGDDRKRIIKKFCELTRAQEINTYISPSADGEIVYYRKPKVSRYHLTICEFYVLFKLYKEMFRKRKFDYEIIGAYIQNFVIENRITAEINCKSEYSNMNERITEENVKLVLQNKKIMDDIICILSSIDYQNEERIRSSMQRYPYSGIENSYITEITNVIKG